MSVNHVESGLELQLTQFNESPKLQALLTAFLRQLQEADESLQALDEGKLIVAANGTTLDILGKLVGQERRLMNDTEYRLWIRARIVLNQCRGTAEDMYRVLRVILGEVPALKIIEYPETAFTVHISESVPHNMQHIFDLICAAKPAGVRGQLLHAVKNPVFKFDNEAHKNGYLSALIC